MGVGVLQFVDVADGLEEEAWIALELIRQLVGGFQILVDHHHPNPRSGARARP